VVAIIQAANRLQMVAVERVAVEYLVERLDAGNVLDAMALGAHLEAGALGRDLRDKSRAWLNANFGVVAAEPSFLAFPVAEVASFVESDDLASPEEEVFAAVMAWVNEEHVSRKGELGRLLPLVRFPMMQNPGPAIMREPLVTQHALGIQLLYETTPAFAESAQAAACPRLRPRKGQRLPAQVAAQLAFTRVSAEHYDVSAEGGALLQAKVGCTYRAAVCAGHVMSTGRHAVEFTMVQTGTTNYMFVGLARPDIDVQKLDAYKWDKFWGLYGTGGALHHAGRFDGWAGRQRFGKGDVVGLLLDCDAGTLTVKKNGKRLGVAATGLTGEFCWAAAPYRSGSVRIAPVDERGW
jgi:hypothetical protein